jgi:hypothetical protein
MKDPHLTAYEDEFSDPYDFTYPEDDREYPRGGLIGCACLTLAGAVFIVAILW